MLDILRTIVEKVAEAPSSDVAFSIVVDSVHAAIKTEVCSLYCADDNAQSFVLMANRGFRSEQCGKVRIGFDEGLVGMVGERAELLNLSHASAHPRYKLVPELGEEDFEAFLGVPIIHQRRVLGVLVVQQRAPRRFGSDEESFLVTLSAQMAALLADVNLADYFFNTSRTRADHVLKGIPGAMGVAVAPAFILLPPAELAKVPDRRVDDVDEQILIFRRALELARQEVSWLGEQLGLRLPKEAPALFDAYQKILASESLGQEVEAIIKKGWWSGTALRMVVEGHASALDKVSDPYLKDRASDLRDLGRRVLSHLQMSNNKPVLNIKQPVIVIADEISPSMLAEVPKDKLKGIVSVRGSLTSHATILAKALNVPAVLGVPNIKLLGLEGRTIIVDGYTGQINLSPSPALIKEYRKILEEEKRIAADLEMLERKEAITIDDRKVPILINTGLYADLVKSRMSGVSGIGLYRSEIPFMHMERFPSEQEQIKIYREALAIFSGYPVAMRTLDIGADKELQYFSFKEPNPYLGWRGIRVTLDHPEIFLVQVRAMLKASESLNNLHITLPMISHVSEIDESIRLIKQAFDEIMDEKPDARIAFPKIGAMIEVPSAVVQAEEIARRVDYFSIGSNDLTQYILAVDRHNSQVASLYDALHPAVIRSIQQVIDTAHRNGIYSHLCGEVAGDPMGALVYVGLGIDGLSMNGNSMSRIKKMIRAFRFEELQHIAMSTVSMENAQEVRQFLYRCLDENQLGGLVRAGQ